MVAPGTSDASGADGSNSDRPKMSLPDSCVEYMVLAIHGQDDTRKAVSSLEAIRKAAVRLADQLTSDYIWQRDSFKLDIKSHQGLLYLHGVTEYGDSVEDEWLVVYLLRELTKTFQDAWVRVFDADGEFLLVEAASVVPKWLNPEIDANRVWIHQGQLRIVPLSTGKDTASRIISLQDALQAIRTVPETLTHSSLIDAEAFYRLEKYPGQIEKSIHHALATIPRKLAYILHLRPKAIAPGVEAFYLRDPSAIQQLFSPTPSPSLEFPPNDLVTVSVRFTKVLFAQLKSQRFKPPPNWARLLSAAEKDAQGGAGSRDRHCMLEIGMKLACGFDMLAAKADESNSRTVREVSLILQDLREDADEGLPTDDKIKTWPGVDRADNESWLDINFQDFERELEGRPGRPRDESTKQGFGDPAAQADLHRIVARFEAFLNDEGAGIEGAEIDDMDQDDDDGEDDDSADQDSDDEDKEVSFDEDEFARAMREMMGLPPEEPSGAMGSAAKTASGDGATQPASLDGDEAEIRSLAAQMESELNEHGALRLDPTPKKSARLSDRPHVGRLSSGTSRPPGDIDSEDDEDESGEDEVDLDYNLAKNLLESFKGQAGMAGPTGNLLRMMGMTLPRDEEDDDSDGGGEKGENM